MNVTQSLKSNYFDGGAIKMAGMLDPEMVGRVRACLDWGIANPSPSDLYICEGTSDA